ncbi:MAG: helix-turn-helix domain-containing protein [Halarcobacter sp.]
MNEFSTTQEISKEFAHKIKDERLRQNITQEDMALKSGLSLSTYKIFEKNGKGSFENFINITKALGKTMELNNLFIKNSFSPKEKVLNKNIKKPERKRASKKEKIDSSKSKNESKPTRIGILLDKLKAKNENE